MKQHLTATFIFDPMDMDEVWSVNERVKKLKESGYEEKLRNMNKEGQVIVKLELEETL